MIRRPNRTLLALAAGAIALTAANVASASAPAKYADGLHISTGALVAPDGRVWVSDHNGGFCRVTEPTEDAPGSIDHSIANPTCLGGLLPGAKPGPDAAGQPSLFDPSPDFPNSGDELAFVPDGAAPSSEVFRLRWNADSRLFEFDENNPLDLISMNADPDQPDRARPTASSVGPDGRVYVVFQRSSSIQRITRPASNNPLNPPQAQLIGRTSDDRGTSAIAAGWNSAGAFTIFVGETTGVAQITAPLTPGVAKVPVPAGVTPDVAGAGGMTYDLVHRDLYVGSADALEPGDFGIDVLHKYNMALGGGGTETDPDFPVTGFTTIGGLGLDTRAGGGVFALDDPAIITPGEPLGLGRLFHVGRPVARILTGPEGETSDTTPTFTIAGAPTLECKFVPVDASFAACAAHPFVTLGDPVSLTPTSPLADGLYRLVVRSNDGGTTGYVDSRAFRVDTAAPATPAIVAPLDGATTNASPWFVFDAAGETDPGYQCNLDGTGFVACAAGRTYPVGTLTGGPHSLTIRSIDAAGNPSAPSAPIVFTPDVTIPNVVISSPVAGPATQATDVSLEFSADDPDGPLVFGCRIDEEQFAACSSPMTYSGLTDGVHTFEVHAADVNGNYGPPTAVDVTVDTTAPVINSTGWASVTSLSGVFALVANENVAFRFALDGAPLEPFSPPGGVNFSFTALDAGVHTLTVEATDEAGNVSTATHTFTVTVPVPPAPAVIPATDVVPPAITIISPTLGEETHGTLEATFTAVDPNGVASVTCAIDAVSIGACTSPLPISGLEVGPHTLTVRATDAFGNSASATQAWQVISGGGGGVTTPLARALTLGRAVVPASIGATAVVQTGLPVAVTAPQGTTILRVRVFTAKAGKRPVATVFVSAKRGTSKLRLRQAKLVKVLRAGGTFRVELTPGTSRTALGTSVVRTTTVRAAKPSR